MNIYTVLVILIITIFKLAGGYLCFTTGHPIVGVIVMLAGYSVPTGGKE